MRAAFLAVVADKGYERTSVSGILARANIGRTTFYAHFRNKQALLDSGLDGLRALLQAAARQPSELLAFSLPLLEHAAAHRTLFQSLLRRRGGETVLGQLRGMVAELARAELLGKVADLDAVVAYCVGSYFSLVSVWLGDPKPPLPAQIDALFRRLTMPGLAAALR